MKLVIDIDDELYKAICDCDDAQILSHFAIKHGIPYEERPHGEWIFHRYDHNFECSNCHVRFDEDEFGIEIPDRGNVWHKVHRYKYCPLCGSDNQKDDWAKEGDDK